MATKKPTPRAYPQPPAIIARALYEAETVGDKPTAREYGVHHHTIENWRAKYRDDPTICAAVERLRAAVASTWLAKARAVREKLIDRVGAVAEESDDLVAITKALTAVDEVIVGHEVLNDPDVDSPRSDRGGEEDEAQEA